MNNHFVQQCFSQVEKWYAKLFPMLIPYLWKNGGPIGLIQVENEYGSFSSCDIVYTTYLRDLFRSYVGYDTELISVDGGALSYLKCGFIPDVYPTVDGGASPSTFSAQRTYAPRGPLVNTEYYPGWLDLWGNNFSVVSTSPILRDMRYMYNLNASFNFYMFEGGTNFGYMNGAGNPYQPVTTSYDYDAPLSEADELSPSDTKIRSTYPLSMEDIDFPYGFVLYETVIPGDLSDPLHRFRTLASPGVADRGYVTVNNRFQGTLFAQLGPLQNHSIRIEACNGDHLQLEKAFKLLKGRRSMLKKKRFSRRSNKSYRLNHWKEPYIPSIFAGEFTATTVADTFFNSSGWGKGQIFINRFNLGRYWPTLGPQVTLYVPKPVLSTLNFVVSLELEKPGNCVRTGEMCYISFSSKPKLNETVPSWKKTMKSLKHHHHIPEIDMSAYQ